MMSLTGDQQMVGPGSIGLDFHVSLSRGLHFRSGNPEFFHKYDHVGKDSFNKAGAAGSSDNPIHPAQVPTIWTGADLLKMCSDSDTAGAAVLAAQPPRARKRQAPGKAKGSACSSSSDSSSSGSATSASDLPAAALAQQPRLDPEMCMWRRALRRLRKIFLRGQGLEVMKATCKKHNLKVVRIKALSQTRYIV